MNTFATKKAPSSSPKGEGRKPQIARINTNEWDVREQVLDTFGGHKEQGTCCLERN